jgi:radical SAM superfamily enzyme YgiQ (UPF0313 family)
VTLVLWSFYSPDAGAMAAELAAVRAAAPGPAGSLVLHVAGGVHATAEPQHVLDYGWDLAAIGEGEATILALVPALRDGAELTGVPGLAVRDDDGWRCARRRRRSCRRAPSPPSRPVGSALMEVRHQLQSQGARNVSLPRSAA